MWESSPKRYIRLAKREIPRDRLAVQTRHWYEVRGVKLGVGGQLTGICREYKSG